MPCKCSIFCAAVLAGPANSPDNPCKPWHQQEQVLQEVAEAEKQLAALWHGLPASSSCRLGLAMLVPKKAWCWKNMELHAFFSHAKLVVVSV